MIGTRSAPATLALLLGLGLCGALFLAAIGIDALEGRNAFQFFADSRTYHEVARGDLLDIEAWQDAVTVGGNFLGPLAVLRLTGQNYYLVLILNVALFAASTLSISHTLRLDSLRYTLVLLVNPVILTSMLSVNKEVLAIAAIACILRAYRSGSAVAWILGAALCLLVRWQMLLFVIVLAALVGRTNPARAQRALTLVALLVLLSVLYAALADVFEPIRNNFEEAAQEYEGSGLYEWLVAMQNAGYYWLVFPLKAAHLLFGAGLRFDRLFAPTDFYNDVIQLLHSTAMLVLFVLLGRRSLIRLRNDLIYLSALYLALFAISPIYTPRYFLPVYVLWAAVLVGGRNPPALFRPARPPRMARRRPRILPRDVAST